MSSDVNSTTAACSTSNQPSPRVRIRSEVDVIRRFRIPTVYSCSRGALYRLSKQQRTFSRLWAVPGEGTYPIQNLGAQARGAMSLVKLLFADHTETVRANTISATLASARVQVGQLPRLAEVQKSFARAGCLVVQRFTPARDGTLAFSRTAVRLRLALAIGRQRIVLCRRRA